MMEGVSAATLVTYLVTSRAGLPPWNTRIDWVALVIDNWDLVDFSSLPLTREHVRAWYIPHRAWTLAATWTPRLRSPFSSPLLAGADLKLVKGLANPAANSTRRPLNEASPDACLCPDRIATVVVFKNKWIRKYIPAQNDHRAHPEPHCHCHHDHDHDHHHHHHHHDHHHHQDGQNPGPGPDFDVRELATPKPQPKSAASKVRLGRRAAKKAAAAAAAADTAAPQAQPQDEKNKENNTKRGKETETAATNQRPQPPSAPAALETGHAALVSGSHGASDDDVPLSEQMLALADRFDEFAARMCAVVGEMDKGSERKGE
ncbi:hypothetical protein BT67DRAFT_296745 [Trichocladium antarcticum]|uniref:Uncharacterized protein n=1 Tax=Trichocladium antarcticum TaxID=1450529 RepID=A0AAN6ZE52_9PEZI|nr:hypothetical protein BT67DRAFT_296745 [Trichocladium antarcticum]